MNYEVNENDILELVRMAYEQGASGYSDLKDSFCEMIVSKFFSDKKRITPITNLSLQTSVSVDGGHINSFGSDVYTITGTNSNI